MTADDAAKYRNDWVRIAKYVGADDDIVEDIVHDFFIKLRTIEKKEGSLKRFINTKGKLNDVFVFRVLKNMVINHIKKNQRFIPINNNDFISNKIPDDYFDVMEILNNCHWYDKEIILELSQTNHTIRSLSRETKIPYNSIRFTFNKTKDKIKKIFNDDENKFKRIRGHD